MVLGALGIEDPAKEYGGREGAEGIVNLCGNLVLGEQVSRASAQYASDLFNSREQYEYPWTEGNKSD